MAQSARIAMVRKHREQSENSAARRLGTAHHALRDAADTLENLDRHRAGYEAQILTAARAGVSAATLQRALRFLRTLGDAVDSQEVQVSQSRSAVSSLKDLWMDKYRARETLSRLEDQCRDVETRDQDRREAAEQDEIWASAQRRSS